MIEVILKIPEENIAEVIETILWLQPIPQIPDPDWVYSEEIQEAPLIDEYTEAQWGKEFIRRWLIQNVKNKRKTIAAENARIAVEAVENDFIE